ncbi:hypothetical protein ACIGJK_03675 [Pseudomonas iridis]|uniref:hypothetical protein n=1 Tax=Pseudomonas iridis TaxID=2710587 RepID=UPI0037CA0929
MQKAILCVLILIAVLIAPWILWVAAALAAVAGVWLAAAVVIVVVIAICGLAWKVLSGQTEAGRARRIARIAERSNNRFREKDKVK